MSEKPTAEVTAGTGMRRFREYVTAALAAIITLGEIVILVMALLYTGSSDEFARVKDLLLIINPLLGVVIGYYFASKSGEARAESAEQTAQTATLSAQQAIEARNAADADAQAALIEAEEATSTLLEVSQAAESALAQMPAPAPATLGVGEEGTPVEDARLELRVALARAKRITG